MTLITEAAPQRRYALRAVFNGLRWLVRAGAPWRLLPNALPPWEVVSQHTHRWVKVGVFEALVQDVRAVLRVAAGRPRQLSAAMLASRPLPSSPESGGRAGYAGADRRRGRKGHRAVDTLDPLLALPVPPANEQDRARGKALATHVQVVTGETGKVACGDQGYTDPPPPQDAAQAGITRAGVKLPAAQKGFVLLPRRGVVERSFGWMARFRRLESSANRLKQRSLFGNLGRESRGSPAEGGRRWRAPIRKIYGIA